MQVFPRVCTLFRFMASPYDASRSLSLDNTTLGKTPLDQWSALRRDLYLTTHNTHTRQTSMTQAGFEPRPQTHA